MNPQWGFRRPDVPVFGISTETRSFFPSSLSSWSRLYTCSSNFNFKVQVSNSKLSLYSLQPSRLSHSIYLMKQKSTSGISTGEMEFWSELSKLLVDCLKFELLLLQFFTCWFWLCFCSFSGCFICAFNKRICAFCAWNSISILFTHFIIFSCKWNKSEKKKLLIKIPKSINEIEWIGLNWV